MLPDRDFIYTAVTREIRVIVHPFFDDEHSKPEKFEHVFTYEVTIENHSMETVQLLRRKWVIIDGHGKEEKVEGEGVVGQTPTIRPGQSHGYKSYVVLPTPSGLMHGQYEMRNQNGYTFWVAVPVFSLDMPDRLTKVH